MLSALIKAFAQLSDPRLRRVLRLGVLTALGCWLALALTASAVLRHVRLFDTAWIDAGGSALLGNVMLLPLRKDRRHALRRSLICRPPAARSSYLP